jgi:small-conductance mechanosensitive channel
MAASPTQATSPTTHSLRTGLSADSIDTLPVLSALLSRLQNPSNTSSTAASPPAASPSQIASGSVLTIKDIATATDELKHKLQKARVQVKELPDMQRSVPEQEQEIRELQERIRKQREVLEGLRDVGMLAKREREQRESDGGADAMEI